MSATEKVLPSTEVPTPADPAPANPAALRRRLFFELLEREAKELSRQTPHDPMMRKVHADRVVAVAELLERGPAWLLPEPEAVPAPPAAAPHEAGIQSTAMAIASECSAIERMLIEKNRKYGNSALSPKRVFSKASPVEQILVRIDDKLSRIGSAQPDETEDAVLDLIGYLILLRVARRLGKA
jgi:hypothetical protein